MARTKRAQSKPAGNVSADPLRAITPDSSVSGACTIPRPSKILNVTITIVSLAGVHVKESAKSKSKKYTSKLSPKRKKDDSTEDTSLMTDAFAAEKPPRTTVVASFSRVTSSNKSIMTHVPSVPIEFSKSGKAQSNLIRWPFEQVESDGAAQGVSSFQFQRTFTREEEPNTRKTNHDVDHFVPQHCSIRLAISRNGKMFKLGSADVLVSGEENGESSINVPVVSESQLLSKGPSKLSSEVPMIRLKGQTLKCGVTSNATLRVLVQVSEPTNILPKISLNITPTSVQAVMPSENAAHKELKQVISEQKVSLPNVPPPPLPSEASWEYDPVQSAVVLKQKKTPSGTETVKSMIPKAAPERVEGSNEFNPKKSIQVDVSSLVETAFSKDGKDSLSKSTASMTLDQFSWTSRPSWNSSVASDESDTKESCKQSTYSQSGIEVHPYKEAISMVSSISSAKNGIEAQDGVKHERTILENVVIRTTQGQKWESKSSRDDAASHTSSIFESSLPPSSRESQPTSFPHVTKIGAKNWKQRFICGLQACGAHPQDETLSCVDDNDLLEDDVLGANGYEQWIIGQSPSQYSSDNSEYESLSDSDSEFMYVW